MISWIIGEIPDGEVPILDEMTLDIDDCGSLELQGNIVPGHSWFVDSVKITFPEFSGLGDTSQSVTAVICSAPETVHINNWMLMIVPSTITNIKSAHKGNFLINNTAFFMMRPQLRYDQTRMTQNFKVFIHLFKRVPYVEWIIVDEQAGFLENKDKNFDTTLCCSS